MVKKLICETTQSVYNVNHCVRSVDVHAARGVSTSKTISVSEVILGSSGVPQ